MVKVVAILSIVTCLLTLTSVGLTAYHSVGHSYVKFKASGLVIKTTSSNTEGCPPAVKVKSDNAYALTVISCPFKPATKAIAFISLILCQFLLILLCCKLKNKVSSMVIVIFAIIDFPLLLVGGILMIVDMINGKKELGDLGDYSYQPIEYIIDVLFLFFGLICGGIATFLAYTSKPPAQPSNYRGSQPTQHGNASMSVTKPHWTEGESQSQSTDYIKPYAQANNINTYQAYQGGSAMTSHNTSTAYLQNSPTPGGRGSQVYQNQNEQYLESSQNYDNTGGNGNRRNISYKDNPQTRQRQQSNAQNYNPNANQQGNNGYDTNSTSSYGNTPQRNMNRNMNNYENNSASNNGGNQNNHNGSQNNSMAGSMAGPQSRGTRNNYPVSNQSQMYSNNNNNETAAYERSPERNPERSPDRYYANNGNGGSGRPNKFNSAVNRIGAMRGGANAMESGSNNKGYLNYGNESNNQGKMNNFDENPLDYYSSSPNNRGRSKSNNQSNYQEQQYQEEGNYQRGNQNQGQGQGQRNTHVSQINGNSIPYNNSNGMGRPAANSIGNNRPSQNYGAY